MDRVRDLVLGFEQHIVSFTFNKCAGSLPVNCFGTIYSSTSNLSPRYHSRPH
jgi:hypothetical protein